MSHFDLVWVDLVYAEPNFTQTVTHFRELLCVTSCKLYTAQQRRYIARNTRTPVWTWSGSSGSLIFLSPSSSSVTGQYLSSALVRAQASRSIPVTLLTGARPKCQRSVAMPKHSLEVGRPWQGRLHAKLHRSYTVNGVPRVPHSGAGFDHYRSYKWKECWLQLRWACKAQWSNTGAWDSSHES